MSRTPKFLVRGCGGNSGIYIIVGAWNFAKFDRPDAELWAEMIGKIDNACMRELSVSYSALKELPFIDSSLNECLFNLFSALPPQIDGRVLEVYPGCICQAQIDIDIEVEAGEVVLHMRSIEVLERGPRLGPNWSYSHLTGVAQNSEARYAGWRTVPASLIVSIVLTVLIVLGAYYG